MKKHKHHKHHADTNNGRNFSRRMTDRLNCKFPLSFYQRMTYPYFCIIILNSNTISNVAKQEFIDNFVKLYISSQDFVKNISSHSISFTRDHYLGCLNDSQLEDFIKEYEGKRYSIK